MPLPELKCILCTFVTKSLKVYVDHYQLHRSVANFNYPCGLPGCSRRFQKYAAFRSHMYRDHRGGGPARLGELNLACQISFCAFTCNSLSDFMLHLKKHLTENVAVACPFNKCNKTFTVKSSFTSHISRIHREPSASDLCDKVTKPVEIPLEDVSLVSAVNVDLMNYDTDMEIDDCSVSCPVTDTSQLMRSLALFYLKLQAKLLLPASTIQSIVDEMETYHTLGLSVGLKNMSEKLASLNLPETFVKDIISDMLNNNPFKMCTAGELRSHQTRQTFYKRNFKFVSPKEIYLGTDENKIARFAQYVPIKESIMALFADASVKSAYRNTYFTERADSILRDVTDGRAFRGNAFFAQNLGALRIILYQDSFEVANPLGSGKKKHKILAVYFSLANFPPHMRSSVDQIQLVLLCRESDFKWFGQEIVFSELIGDLQSLEDIGLPLLDGQEPILGTVLAIAGDNLGSHCIGGFTENFSTSKHVCRYCLVDRESCIGSPHVIGESRSEENYNESANNLNTSAAAENYGIKFPSIFNKLKHYHVCKPGLPPCLGHDLFEGVVSRDVALLVKHFVKVEKFFTYQQLNRLIKQFKYTGSDVENKPCEVKDGADKISGNAAQNWCFLRLLPLLIGDIIANKDSQFWMQLLLLREIVELICAPTISLNQVALLKDRVTDYLQNRVSLFPSRPTTPKHHFLAHYAGLILQFGPLIRV
jgi:hypothetical protein